MLNKEEITKREKHFYAWQPGGQANFHTLPMETIKKKKAGLIVLKYIAELDRQKESAEG